MLLMTFSYQAPVVWNRLPVAVRHSASVSFFIFPENLSLFKSLFFSPIALLYDSLSLPLSLSVSVCLSLSLSLSLSVCVCVCVRLCCMR